MTFPVVFTFVGANVSAGIDAYRTDKEFEDTVHVMKEVEFDSAYMFKYSEREGTIAKRKLPDDVPIIIKERRNAELLSIQNEITDELNREWVGQTIEVFVEGFSPKDASRLLGCSHQEKKVVFSGEKTLLGTQQQVKIEELRHETYLGSLLVSRPHLISS